MKEMKEGKEEGKKKRRVTQNFSSGNVQHQSHHSMHIT